MKIANRLKKVVPAMLAILPALKLVWQSSPRLTIVRGIIEILLGILPIGLFYIGKLLIDTLSSGDPFSGDRLFSPPTIWLLLVAIAIGTTQIICNAVLELINTAQSRKVIDYTQDILHGKSIEVDLAFYENPAYHNTLQRAQQEGSYRPLEILKRIVNLTYNGFSLLAVVGVLFYLHWSVPFILLLAGLPVTLARMDYSLGFHRWFTKQTEQNRLSWYISNLMLEDTFAKELRLFSLGNFLRRRFKHIRQRLYRGHLNLARRRFILTLLAKVVSGCLVFGLLIFVVYQAFEGRITVGSLVFYYQIFNRGQNSIGGLFGSIAGLYEDGLFLSNLSEFLGLESVIKDPQQPQSFAVPINRGIYFKGVSFQYEGSTRYALKDINLVLEPKKTIAIVGENGSGKTTLIKLLCRLYDPTSGTISIDGIHLKDFKINDLRSRISVVFQDYAKYQFTAKENIWFGDVNQTMDSTRLSKAAFQSGADRVIKTLPYGYDTILGKRFEKGEELSIGQWQKVALARAFFKSSQIVILDEPTSALDPEAEYELFQKFQQLMQNQTAIVITHRLASARRSDKIYVMERGTIVETGTHDQLMTMNGTYRRMFDIQANYYR